MSLKIRRGTDAERAVTPLDLGEIAYTTDTKQLYVGNGIDAGGTPIIRLGTGLEWADAQCTTIVSTATGGGILSVSADTTPSLGGNLSLNTHDITGTGNIDIVGNVTGSRLTLSKLPLDSGLKIESNLGGASANDWFTINTHHADTEASIAFFTRSRGTYASPTAILNGDGIFNLAFSGRTPGGVTVPAVAIGAEVDGTVSTGVLPGKVVIYTTNASGDLTPALTIDKAQKATFSGRLSVADGTASAPSLAFTTDGGFDTGFSHPGDGIIVVSTNATETARFDSGGFRSVGFVKVKDFAGTLPSPPEAGMIVLDGATFKGYNGSAWVDLN